MSAKPLESEHIMMARPVKASMWPQWMVKRHVRSVHRETYRRQGSRSPQRQFGPVIRSDADDDGVTMHGSQHDNRRFGEPVMGPSGFEAVACMERSELELGRAYGFPQGYEHPTKRRMHR